MFQFLVAIAIVLTGATLAIGAITIPSAPIAMSVLAGVVVGIGLLLAVIAEWD